MTTKPLTERKRAPGGGRKPKPGGARELKVIRVPVETYDAVLEEQKRGGHSSIADAAAHMIRLYNLPTIS